MSGAGDLWPEWAPDTQPDADDPYWLRYEDCLPVPGSFLFQAGNLEHFPNSSQAHRPTQTPFEPYLVFAIVEAQCQLFL